MQHRSRETDLQPAEERLLRAARFIETSIGQPISLLDIAERAGLSPYHFDRLFRSRFGLPVMDYVRRRRLTIAAKRLLEPDEPIIEIALDAGFDSQAAFTRAFCRIYRRPPAAYRALKRDVPWLSVSAIAARTLAMLPGVGGTSPRCVATTAIRLAGLETTLTASQRHAIPELWLELADRLRHSTFQGPGSYCGYGISEPVPHASDGVLRYAAAVAIDPADAVPRGLIVRHIPAGRYLVFPFSGGREGLPNAIDYLYGTWIPGSRHVLRRAPTVEFYVNAFDDCEPHAAPAASYRELWIPVK